MSILVVLVTGIWQAPVEACHAVSYAFAQFFPHVDIFMALLIFIAGYTTVIAYLTVGEKAMRWLFPQWGRRLYFIYAVCAFIAFSFLDQCHVMTVMSLSGGLLMLTNLLGIWKLRHEVVFKKELIER
jgi:AGCS family alanine or glycine:cation symporter